MDFKKLKEEVGDKLFKANLITAQKILQLTGDELQRIGNFSCEDVKNIFYLASETILKPDFHQHLKLITVGCKLIDQILGGGLKVAGGITELSGESGSGKTQLCLQLALMAQNSPAVGGIDKYVVYVCTEDNFPSKRLQQLINRMKSPFKTCLELCYGDRIYVEHLADVKGLKNLLFSRLPSLLHSGTVGLLIIDSIAALFRAEYSLQEGIQRTKDLRSIGCQLHSLSKKYELCVLCINQVSASLNENDCVPALGLAWANLVTTRIVMRKYSYQEMRKIELVFSPYTGPATCNYIITKSGIRGC